MKRLALITSLVLLATTAMAAGVSDTATPAQKDFFTAVQKGQMQRVMALIAEGVDVNFSIDGMPPLVVAQDPEMVRLLARAGADVNGRAELFKQSILQSAVTTKKPLVVKALIEAGAAVDAVDENTGMTALSNAVLLNETKMMRILIDAGADPNDGLVLDMPLLTYAAMAGKTDIMQMLIEAGADVNAQNKQGATPLMAAVATRKTEAAKLLIEAGADVDARTKPDKKNRGSKTGRTAMDVARVTGDEGMMKVLEKSGAQESDKPPEPDPNSPNAPGLYSLPCNISGSPPPQGREFSCSSIDQVADSGIQTITSSRALFAGKHLVPMKERCQVDLGQSGFYTIRTTRVSTPWELVCRAKLGTTTGRSKWIAFIRKEKSVTQTSESKIVVKEPEKASGCPQQKPDKQSDDPALEELNEALVTALKKFNKHVTKKYTSVKRETLKQFMLRLSSDGCLLPNNETIVADCAQREGQGDAENQKKYEGALRILVGSVQQAEGKTRTNVRIVNVETGEIMNTGKGDANGTDKTALSDSISRAIDKMGFKPSCTKFLGVKR